MKYSCIVFFCCAVGKFNLSSRYTASVLFSFRSPVRLFLITRPDPRTRITRGFCDPPTPHAACEYHRTTMGND